MCQKGFKGQGKIWQYTDKKDFFFEICIWNINLESSLLDAPVKNSIFRNQKVMILGK